MKGTPAARGIHAAVVGGSGVAIVHRTIAEHLPCYHLHEYPPEIGLFPALLGMQRKTPRELVHSTPDLGSWVADREAVLITTFHNFYLDGEYLRTVDPLRRLHYRTILRDATVRSVRRAAHATAVSAFTADLVQRSLGLRERPHVIHNGVDPALFSPRPRVERGLRVLFAGNPIRRKGVEHLASLAAALPEGVELAYTSGSRKTALTSPGTHPRLVRLEPRGHREMPEAYRSSDILFFPTQREGFGLVVAEAMACGLPIVATDCSAVPELVVHGKGGYLFAPNDRNQMQACLERLLRNPSLREDMGAYNRARVLELFTAERMVAQYLELFRSAGARPELSPG